MHLPKKERKFFFQTILLANFHLPYDRELNNAILHWHVDMIKRPSLSKINVTKINNLEVSLDEI